MDEKFVLVSLDEKRAKDLAEVISNNTSRKILDFLSEKEATSIDISKKLGIPISTVEYNVKRLVESGLVEAREFKWSPKGRQQDIYKIKKRYIVITPGKSTELREVLRKIVPVGIFGVVIAGFIEYFTKESIIRVPGTREVITQTVSKSADEVAAISAPVLTEGAKAASGVMANESVINITSQVTQTVNEVVLPNPHYGLWFLIGLIFALIFYFIYNYRFRR